MTSAATAYPVEWRGSAPTLPGPLALAREGCAGLGWYPAATAEVSRFAAARGLPMATVADVLALTSPRQSVRRSVQLAVAYLDKGTLTGTLPNVQAAIAHWERTGVIRGDKTAAFSRALQGDTDAVVVDVWVFRALGLDYPNMTPKRYRSAAIRIKGLATRWGQNPRDTQAAIWVGVRARYGLHGHNNLSMEEHMGYTDLTCTSGVSPPAPP
jgi:hypothetical protein